MNNNRSTDRVKAEKKVDAPKDAPQKIGKKQRFTAPFTLFKKKTKTGGFIWYARMTDEYEKRRETSLGLDVRDYSKSRARAFAIELYRKDELFPPPAEPKKIPTLKEFADYLFNAENGVYLKRRAAMGRPLSGNYIESLKHAMKRLEPLADLPLPDLSLQKIESYMFAQLETSASKTVRTSVSILHLILREAVRYKHITVDPMMEFDLPSKAPKVKRDGLTPEEMNKLFFSGNQSLIWKNNVRIYRAAALLSLTTGMRKGEILALHGSEVHADFLEVKYSWSASDGIKGTKSGRPRIVPLAPPASAVLQELKNLFGEGLLFSLDGKKPINLKTLSDVFASALEHIGIDKAAREARNLTFHSLRVTYNTTMVNYKIQETLLRSIVGHNSQEMTDRYYAPKAADLEAARVAARTFLEEIEKLNLPSPEASRP